MKEFLAARSHAVNWSGIRVMFALAEQIPGVINLGIGQPDFDTPEFIREAAKQALDEGYTRYPPAKGFLDLREAIAEKLHRENRIIADPASEIFVGVGAMQVIFNTILHLIEPGDEVIVIDPGYDYYSQIGLFGGVAVRPGREQNLFKVVLRLRRISQTKLIILNSHQPHRRVWESQCARSLLWPGNETSSCSPMNPMSTSCSRDGSIPASPGGDAASDDLRLHLVKVLRDDRLAGGMAAPAFIIDEMES
jgi:bifunctional pyridoxal-dependent enzyme with beta-cystathionase and maltose regulon repressor activities